MTRYLVGFVLALVLGVMGCSETGGTGGSGGSAGTGGIGGTTAREFPCTEQGIRDAIVLGDGPHTFDCDDGMTVVTKAEIVIDNDVSLDGEGHLTVDGDDDHTVFSVVEGVVAEMEGFAVTGGGSSRPADQPSEGGAGIYNAGSLTLVNSTVSGNTPASGQSVIANVGTLNMLGVTVSDNACQDFCAAISNSGTMFPSVSIFDPLPTLTMTNSTVSRNLFGDAIRNSGTLKMNYCTVSPSPEAPEGLAVHLQPRAVWFVANSVVDGVCSPQGVVVSFGGNIESPFNTCGLTQGSDRVDVTKEQLNLGPLQDNGGPTQTRELLAEPLVSAAIEAAACDLDADQRGVQRPNGDRCDAGAFEFEQKDEACLFSGRRCVSGDVAPIEEMCEITVPDEPSACEGTESIENPTSCAASGNAVAHRLTKMQVAADCNSGYDLDGCGGESCRVGGLASPDGTSGVDNGLAGMGPVLVSVGLRLGDMDQAFHEAICSGAYDIELEVEAVPDEDCAIVTLLSGGVAADPIAMNLSDSGCVSGSVGAFPVRVGEADGFIKNAVVRMTVSSKGFSDGLLGGTIELPTAAELFNEVYPPGPKFSLGAVAGQFADINADLSGDRQVDCNALSMTLEIGGAAIP